MRRGSLRGMFWATVVLLAALLVATAVALVALTSEMNRASSELAGSLDGTLKAERIQTDLVRYAQLSGISPPTAALSREKAQIRGEVQRRIEETRARVDTADERALVSRAVQDIDAFYVAADRERDAGPAHGQALELALGDAADAVRRLSELNIKQAGDALHTARLANNWGNIIGGIVLAALAGVGLAIVLGFRRVYQPVAEIETAVTRFVAGERTARAPERGPAELKAISRTFNSAADTLERQLRSVASIAHDIRNPLTSMKMVLILLQREVASLPAVKRVDALRQQLIRVEQMVEDLLDSARIEAGQLAVRFEPADLRNIVHEALGLLPPEQVVRVALEVPETAVELRADPLRLEQVVANLVSNALKYSPAPLPVEVSIVVDDLGAILSVTDHGPGIPPAEQADIFEPFRRSKSASDSAIPGAGLGLSIARRLVEAHGGSISVVSRAGEGTTFRVWLPRNPPMREGEVAPLH